jgi:hypothetical protein
MKQAKTVALSQSAWDGIDRLVTEGDFRGTGLKRRSRSAVLDVLVQFALGKWPAWERERLNALQKGE